MLCDYYIASGERDAAGSVPGHNYVHRDNPMRNKRVCVACYSKDPRYRERFGTLVPFVPKPLPALSTASDPQPPPEPVKLPWYFGVHALHAGYIYYGDGHQPRAHSWLYGDGRMSSGYTHYGSGDRMITTRYREK